MKGVNLILAAFLICLNLTAAGCAVAIGARAGEKIHEELEKKDDKGDSGKEEQGESKTGAGQMRPGPVAASNHNINTPQCARNCPSRSHTLSQAM